MREMGVANSVLETLRRELEQCPGERASGVGLRIGRFAGVDPDSLRFCFEEIAKREGLKPLSLEIEWCQTDELQVVYVEIEAAEVRT
jgi:hydrogenase nickel incorporation protein HypA/HybF